MNVRFQELNFKIGTLKACILDINVELFMQLPNIEVFNWVRHAHKEQTKCQVRQ